MPAVVCAKGATNLCASVQWTACTLGAVFKCVRVMPGVCALLQALPRFGGRAGSCPMGKCNRPYDCSVCSHEVYQISKLYVPCVFFNRIYFAGWQMADVMQ